MMPPVAAARLATSLFLAGCSSSCTSGFRVGVLPAAAAGALRAVGAGAGAASQAPSASLSAPFRGRGLSLVSMAKMQAKEQEQGPGLLGSGRHAKALSHEVGETVLLPGSITSVDHTFRVPLKWGGGDEGDGADSIKVFARELVLTKHKDEQDRPFLLFLQGGPGFPAPRVGRVEAWWGRALKEFRVVMLDQRGTGRSSPVTHRTLAEMDSPEAQAEFLGNFRADSIVEDCEAVRRKLAGAEAKWTVLGQSFGGFCLLTYLSTHPEALQAGLFTGGLPPVGRTPDEVYRATYRRVAERNRRFYKRYPGDVDKVKAILRHLRDNKVTLPAGGVLTPVRFLQLGLALGGAGGFESLHYLLENAFDARGDLSYSFLREVENNQRYDTNPIYAIMHESIYISGDGVEGPSGWSAERVLAEDAEVASAFDWEGALEEGTTRPAYLVAEMIYRWMFDGTYACLAGMKDAAELLANRKDWPALYDRKVLEQCEVPCAAAVYYDDIYVEREFSDETSKIMPDCKIWVTNRYQHSGLREDGDKVLDTLLGMTRGEVELPS
eukprot:g10133.t1